jgi:segregation and condensation protein A
MTDTAIDFDTPCTITNIELGSALVRIRARGKFRDQDAKDFVPTPESTYLYIDTPNYDGPLDLLLHLIKKHSMDIFDIPIGMITQKYLEALDEMEGLNLDIAGEFIVMAATLAEIKSKMLLPKEERPSDAEEEEGEDPRLGLIRRLLLYKSFQEASLELINRPQSGRDWFTRPLVEEEQLDIEEPREFKDLNLSPVEIFQLIEALNQALKKSENVSVHTISKDRISVSARLHELIDFCQLRGKFTFYDALRFFPVYEKIDVIVTFLALLEMSKLQLITIKIDPKNALAMTLVKEHFYVKQKEVLSNLDMGSYEVLYE